LIGNAEKLGGERPQVRFASLSASKDLRYKGVSAALTLRAAPWRIE
jgi:hypothetical protein